MAASRERGKRLTTAVLPTAITASRHRPPRAEEKARERTAR